MHISVLAIISVVLLLGIIYIIYSVRVAEVQEGHLDEPFDEKAFSKPAGWKTGKMPPELQNKKVSLKKIPQPSQADVEDLMEKWKEDLPKIRKTGF